MLAGEGRHSPQQRAGINQPPVKHRNDNGGRGLNSSSEQAIETARMPTVPLMGPVWSTRKLDDNSGSCVPDPGF